MIERQERMNRQALWTPAFILLTLSNLMLFLCLQMLLSPFPSYVKERFNPSDFSVSLVTSTFCMAAVAARILTVALMRRMPRHWILLAGVLIAALATAAYSLADTMVEVLLLRACFGAGFGIGSTVLPTVVSQLIPGSRMGEGIGYFGLSTSLAMSIGPMVGLTVLDSYGFPVLTLFGASAALLIAPLLALSGIGSIPPGSNARPASNWEVGEPSSTRSSRLWLPAGLNILMSAAYGGVVSFLALFGKEAGLENVGLFFLFNAVTVLAVRPLSGRLFDSRGHGVVLIPAAIILMASLALLSVSVALPLLIVSALLFGLGYGSIQPALQAWMLQVTDARSHGAVNGLFYNTIDLGVAFGSMSLGAIASSASYAVMYRYCAGLMLLFVVSYVTARYLPIIRAARRETRIRTMESAYRWPLR